MTVVEIGEIFIQGTYAHFLVFIRFIHCVFFCFETSTLLHEVLWFCTRDVLSQKWPSSNPPSPATFRNLCYHFSDALASC